MNPDKKRNPARETIALKCSPVGSHAPAGSSHASVRAYMHGFAKETKLDVHYSADLPSES